MRFLAIRASANWQPVVKREQNYPCVPNALTVPGVHDYYCMPHEAAGMAGRIVSEHRRIMAERRVHLATPDW